MLTLVCLIALSAVSFADEKVKSIKIKDKDMLRKSIVYDKKTPDVFYCPTSKPTGMDKLIVRCVVVFQNVYVVDVEKILRKI